MRTYNFLTEFPTLHPMDSYPCMSIHSLIPMIELFFLNLTFKIQGQSHSSRPHNRNNILSTHIPLVPCQSALPFPRYSIFKIWPWKSKVKVIAQGHKVGITPYRLTSLLFHVDRPCHSWDTAISKFDVENSRSRSRVRSKLKVITWVLHSVDSHPFRSMSIRHPIPELWLFQNLTLIWQVFGRWANPCGANGQITMTVHNYRSRQVHETLNGVNPSSGFRDMRSAKSRSNLWQIWQVFGPWASPYGANGQMSMTVHNYRPRQFHRTSNGENPSSGYRDMGSANLAAARPTAHPPARPPAWTVTTIPLQPRGLRGKKALNLAVWFIYIHSLGLFPWHWDNCSMHLAWSSNHDEYG